jgi:hypothetical protein
VIDTDLLEKNIDCIVLHDVDLVPSASEASLGDLVDYRCRQMPWHMTNRVLLLKSSRERIYNKFLTGGVLSLRPGHIFDANGFSNNVRLSRLFGLFDLEKKKETKVRLIKFKLCYYYSISPGAARMTTGRCECLI